MPPKLCAGCQSRPRRYACLRCGDALCRRCVAAAKCSCIPVATSTPPPGAPGLGAADPQTSSAAPAPPADPPAALSETPATSTTPRLAPDAGGGRASSSGRGPTVREVALSLLAVQPSVTAAEVARVSGRELAGVKTTLSQLRSAGVLRYTRPPEHARQRGASGTYSLPGAEPQPRSDLEASQLQRPEAPRPAPRVPESATCTGANAVRLHPRARGPVPGQHVRPADFFADKPALPPARPVVPRLA